MASEEEIKQKCIQPDPEQGKIASLEDTNRYGPSGCLKNIGGHLERTVAFELNGKKVSLSVPDDALLVDILRDRLGLTGTKKGCGIGQCGACTVLVNGKPVCSCLTLAATVNDSSVLTIEGLTGKDGKLHPIQKAFIEEGAIQCGFCTPGMILSVKALLDENPDPNRAEVISAISGSLCRCTGYSKIIKAATVASHSERG